MRGVYNINPQLEHYGCMVDLLGRGGLLEEAEALIYDMDVEPDTVIWRSLLSACLVHGNDRLAEIAGQEIIKREPGDDGVYVLLWNIYASSDRWKEALDMRKQMLTRKIFKKPGCSWVEVDGAVHEFLVEDKTHDARREIYESLEGIERHLKMDLRLFQPEENSLVYPDGELSF
jgi:pentatricopeptide repeat protein